MATDFGFVAETAEADATEGSTHGFGDRASKAGFADARGPTRQRICGAVAVPADCVSLRTARNSMMRSLTASSP